MGELAGALIQGGAEVAQGVGNAIFAKRQANIELEKNKELANFQYSKDLEMWNKGNEYNSPKEQMARLRAAGLNPNLVYGSGTVGNATGALPKYQAPRADFSRVPNPINIPQMGLILGQFLDLEKTRANTEQIKEQINLQKQQGLMNKLEMDIKGTALQQSKELFPHQRDAIIQKNKIDLARINMELEKWDIDKGLKGQILENLKADGKIKNGEVDRNWLKDEMMRIGIAESNQRIINSMIDANIKRFDESLAKMGIDPDANIKDKAIMAILEKLGLTVNKEGRIEGFNIEKFKQYYHNSMTFGQ
ncbi:MAG: DNA pilot protein [Microviridae sp.]|nr:MAG: DNA pilot protein [Microviridae sp.]